MVFYFILLNLGGGTELKSKALGGGTAIAVPPGLKPRLAGLQPHPFLRKGEPHPGPKRPDLSYQRGILKAKKSQPLANALPLPQRPLLW